MSSIGPGERRLCSTASPPVCPLWPVGTPSRQPAQHRGDGLGRESPDRAGAPGSRRPAPRWRATGRPRRRTDQHDRRDDAAPPWWICREMPIPPVGWASPSRITTSAGLVLDRHQHVGDGRALEEVDPADVRCRPPTDGRHDPFADILAMAVHQHDGIAHGRRCVVVEGLSAGPGGSGVRGAPVRPQFLQCVEDLSSD